MSDTKKPPMQLSGYFKIAAIGAGLATAVIAGAGLFLTGAVPALATVAAASTVGLGVLGYLSSAVFNVNQKTEALITSFGKHVRTEKNPGLHLKKPWPFNIVTAAVPTDLFQSKETLDTKTKDDLFVKLPIAVQYEVSDTATYYFGNRDPIGNMMKSVSAAVRTATSGKEFQELYSDRDEISSAVIDHIGKEVAEFGLKIRRIIIDEPTAPPEVQAAFNEVRASERLREAAKNKADAHAIEVIKKAEADKTAQKLFGEGAADFRKAILDGYKAQIDELTHDGKVSKEEALHIVMRSMELDALREVASRGNLIITPQNMTSNNLAEIRTLQDMLKERVANDPVRTAKAPPVSVPQPV